MNSRIFRSDQWGKKKPLKVVKTSDCRREKFSLKTLEWKHENNNRHRCSSLALPPSASSSSLLSPYLARSLPPLTSSLAPDKWSCYQRTIGKKGNRQRHPLPAGPTLSYIMISDLLLALLSTGVNCFPIEELALLGHNYPSLEVRKFCYCYSWFLSRICLVYILFCCKVRRMWAISTCFSGYSRKVLIAGLWYCDCTFCLQ